jgi:hypothetical protein
VIAGSTSKIEELKRAGAEIVFIDTPQGLVRKLRPAPEVSAKNPQIDKPRFVFRGGTTYPMNTAQSGALCCDGA